MKTIRGAGLLALAAFVLSACGPAGGAFVGTWTASSGSLTLTCTGNVQTGTISGNYTIVTGTSGDIVLTNASGCNLKYTVSGSTATLEPGQTCTLTFSDGSTAAENWTSSTMVLAADGKTFTFTAAANVPSGSTTCTLAESVIGTKVGT